MRRIHVRHVVPIAAAALLLAACSGGTSGGPSASGSSGMSSSSDTSGADKSVLTLGATLDMYGWDPSSQPGFQNWAAEAVWDRLAMCNSTGDLEPDVADSWEISSDNKTFTAHIRDGMTFSDGTPVDSAAVAANFEYLKTHGGATADYEKATVTTPDASTFVISWPDSQTVMNSKICSPYIAQPSWLAAGTFDSPVGSGPYVIDAANTTTGSVYTFTKNPDNWNSDNYPYQSLVIKVLTNDTAAVSAIKTGQVDAALVGDTSVAEVESSGLDVINFQGQTTRLIIADHKGAVIPALGDVRVRQAMNMVFDKKAMADNLYLGYAEPTAQVFRKGTAAYIDGLKDPYPYDIEAAKKLMADAGYADGFELELPTMEGQNFETLLPYVTQQLAQINIKVTEVPLSGANAISDLLSGKYPVVLWQLGNLGLSQLQIYIEMTPDGWWNLEHQPDEYVDSRYKAIATATPEESAKLQQEINQYVVDQAWFAPMVYMGTHFAYNADKVSFSGQSDQEALTPRLRDFK